MNKPFKQDWRYAQANREALLTLGAYGLYFVWWYACAYGLGGGDPEGYTYIFGLPRMVFPELHRGVSAAVGAPVVHGPPVL